MSVQGLTSFRECVLLRQLASEVSTGCIVEIGSFRGRSTIALAIGSLEGYCIPVYAVEPHNIFVSKHSNKFGTADRKAFLENILKTETYQIIRLINLTSEQTARLWSNDIMLLWIDGDHEYLSVKNDYENWQRYLLPGGLLIFHDSLQSGPRKVIHEAISSNTFSKVLEYETITVLRANPRQSTQEGITDNSK
jgi:predicted O-methyltransferase YrrM